MRHAVHLLLAAATLHAACAASLPDRTRLNLQPTPEEVNDKEPVPPIDEQPIKEIESDNALRAKPDDIPVAVIIEDPQPAIKINEINDDEEIQRPAVDLRNPGPPQRQEHETQNPDHFQDAQEKLSAVRNTIIQTQDLLRQGVKGVGDDISNWLSTNEQISAIQQNIQSLRDTFAAQIQKLNEAIQGLAAPQAAKPEETPKQPKADFTEVENRIKILEKNFNNGVRALSEGVSIVAILRAEDESGAPAEPTPAPAPAAPTTSAPGVWPVMVQFMTNFQNNLSDSIRNVTTALTNVASNVPALQNFINPSSTEAPGVLADTPQGSTQAPANNPWQPWQLPTLPPNLLQNFFGQSQGQAQEGQTPAPQGPVAQGIQSIQNNIQNGYQNLISLIRPVERTTTTVKPAEAVGTNAVPEKLVSEKQPEEAIPASSATLAPIGPIRQILNNSPVVQRISGTVQKIQSSLNNPEKPRDSEKGDSEKSDDVATKGGFYRPYGYGGIGGGGSDNISTSGLKSNQESIKEEIISEKEEEKESSPKEVSEKTE